jgi:tetratricopeptide (TPR) repeat protein
MDPTLGVRRPKEPYKDPVSGTRHFLFATRDGDRFVTANMMVVEHVIMNNKWERPVYFSSNPTDKSRLGLENHTRIVGQAFEVFREEVRMDFDWPAMDSLMDNVYQYRSYDDPTIGLDDNAVGLAVAFPERMFALGEYARRQGDTARWEYWLQKAKATFPFYSRAHEQVATFTRLRGDSARADQLLSEGLATISRYAEEMPDNRMYWYFKGQMAEYNKQDDLAMECMARAFWLNPNDGLIFGEYAEILQRLGKTSEAARAANKYLTYYPNDQRARQVAGRIR